MARALFSVNSFVADASSLIYLTKSSILRPFLRVFRVTVPLSVYQECVPDGYPGSDEIRELRKNGELSVHPVRESPDLQLALLRGGERDAIVLYYQLSLDGLLIDDGYAVKVCRNRGIPFVSALLIPSLLLMKKAIGTKKAEESLEKIVEVGRYSERVIIFARNVFAETMRYSSGWEGLELTALGGSGVCEVR